ncbi:MAG TPA: hypothetical protein VIK10_12840 [Prolixibacteraceae bacterium]
MAKIITLRLKIGLAQESDVKRGWVRMSSKVRGKMIKREGIYKIQNINEFVYRMVLGGDVEAHDHVILIDHYTRDILKVDLINEYELEFKEANFIERIFFYWKHPDYTFRAGYRLAWYLGGISIILGAIGVYISCKS